MFKIQNGRGFERSEKKFGGAEKVKLKELQDMNYEQRTKNKEMQIEEMAKDYYGYSIDSEADCKFVAEEMYNKGHRKLPEDSVVLSREEYIDLSRNYVGEQVAQIRKETAEKILDLLVPNCKACDENWHSGCLCLRATLAEKIAKQFGVEVEE